MTNVERFKSDLKRLLDDAERMYLDLAGHGITLDGEQDEQIRQATDTVKDEFSEKYQGWYTVACAVIKQLIPDRLAEFVSLYRCGKPRKAIDVTNFTIQDWLNGFRANEQSPGTKLFNDRGAVVKRFDTQIRIVAAAQSRFDSSLFDIRQLVRADLLDSEIAAARELLKHGFGRAAGVVSGVVIEKHLGQICSNHSLTLKKKNPTISDYNDLLKTSAVYDVPQWRQIQRLADIRNLCCHKSSREPTDTEVEELIDGSDKISKTIF